MESAKKRVSPLCGTFFVVTEIIHLMAMTERICQNHEFFKSLS